MVFTYYPAIGGHNDNMQAGWIVRGASSLLDPKAMPVFLYVRDYFTTRLSYIPDVAVDIESVWDVKLNACGRMCRRWSRPTRIGWVSWKN